MIEFFIFILTSIPAMLMYFPLHRPASYESQMKSLGCGIDIPWIDDETRKISVKRIELNKMSSFQLKQFEQELRDAGLDKANSVHSYREFKIKEKLSFREDRMRIRDKMRESLQLIGINPDSINVSKLDGLSENLGIRPSIGIIW